MQDDQKFVYRTLDALRGLAAICIMLYHYAPYVSAGDVLPSSYLAVDLFFALSGFVIAHAYDDRLRQGLGFPAFLRIRLIRLYPLYIAGTLAGVLFVAVRTQLEPAKAVPLADLLTAFIENALFIPDTTGNPNLDGTFPFDQAAWSLSFEVAVNLIYAACFRFLTVRTLQYIVAASAVLLAVCSWQYGTLDIGMTTPSLAGGAVRTCFSFFAGVLIFRMRAPRMTLGAPVACFLLVVTLGIFLAEPEGTHRIIFNLVAVSVLFPLIIYCGGSCGPIPSIGWIFDWGAAVSYAVYILHVPLSQIMVWICRSLARTDPVAALPASGLIFVAAVLVISHAACVLYDRPLRRFLGARLTG